jgi:galactokinase
VNLSNAVGRFHQLFPGSPEPSIWRAPGRVNLIGEHTDYNLGLVLPMAIEFSCFVLTARSSDGRLRVYSEQLGAFAEWPLNDIPSATPQGGWRGRVAGVAWELIRSGINVAAQNVLIDSEVPLGAGLSSSAALGVALAMALGGVPAGQAPPLARNAEVDFVGVPCGIMDHFVSAHGQRGAAILLDCRNLDWRPVPLPAGLAIVVVNSMVQHELSNSGYRARVAECAAAAEALGVASLRDARRSAIEQLDPVLRRRARHVITENARVEQFAAAATAGDLPRIGRLATESHRSLRDDYEVSCPEIDFLVDAACAVPGVLGARITGGGFGGCIVSFVRPDSVESLKNALRHSYFEYRGIEPDVYLCVPAPGASHISLGNAELHNT